METASDIQELIHAIGDSSFIIGDSNPKFSSIKSVVVEIKTWDNKIVRGSIYKGCKRPEVISAKPREGILTKTPRMDSNLLWSHVKSLLKTGKSFIVRIGPICDACLSEWTISDN